MATWQGACVRCALTGVSMALLLLLCANVGVSTLTGAGRHRCAVGMVLPEAYTSSPPWFCRPPCSLQRQQAAQPAPPLPQALQARDPQVPGTRPRAPPVLSPPRKLSAPWAARTAACSSQRQHRPGRSRAGRRRAGQPSLDLQGGLGSRPPRPPVGRGGPGRPCWRRGLPGPHARGPEGRPSRLCRPAAAGSAPGRAWVWAPAAAAALATTPPAQVPRLHVQAQGSRAGFQGSPRLRSFLLRGVARPQLLLLAAMDSLP